MELSQFEACTGEPMETALTGEQAAALLYRALHEAGHLAETITEEGTGGLVEPAGTPTEGWQGTEDHGWFRAAAADVRIGASEGTCLTVAYTCWTGGHGGWGLSALEGNAFVAVTTDEGVTSVQVVGDLGLVDAYPLLGAPVSWVDVRADVASNASANAEGTVGEFAY